MPPCRRCLPPFGHDENKSNGLSASVANRSEMALQYGGNYDDDGDDDAGDDYDTANDGDE